MTHDNSSDTTPVAESDSGTLFNTAAGWVLFAAGLGLGLSILSAKYFHGNDPVHPEVEGYAIEVAEEEAGPGEMSLAEAFTMVSVEDGERVFAKCSACHSIEQGGANGIGPNLYGVMGPAIGGHAPGYDYSSALAGKGGSWTWEEMDAWLKNPRGYAEGTKMGFAGLPDIEDRAAVSLYLNSMGSSLTVPEFTPEEAEAAEETADADVEEVAEEEQNEAEATAEETEAAEAE